MSRKAFIMGALLAAGSVAALLAAATASGVHRWEYAVYLEYPGNYEWQAPNQAVRGTTADTFFGQMAMPTGGTLDARAGNLRTMLFNHVGQQGWELVQILKDGAQETYWFKRAR